MKSITFKSKNSYNVAKFIDNSRSKLLASNRHIEEYSINVSREGLSSATIYFY